jgi:hypothetical protein
VRTWRRFGIEKPCGYCRERMPAGEAVLEIGGIGTTRVLYRCQRCAGEPVAEIVPESRPVRHSAPPMQPLSAIVPFDWKAKQAGDV